MWASKSSIQTTQNVSISYFQAGNNCFVKAFVRKINHYNIKKYDYENNQLLSDENV